MLSLRGCLIFAMIVGRVLQRRSSVATYYAVPLVQAFQSNRNFAARRNNDILLSRPLDRRIIRQSTRPLISKLYLSNQPREDATLSIENTDFDNIPTQFPSKYNAILQDLNPSQVQAVTQPLQSITRVVAGPGSGKTRVLTSRIAYLLQEDPNRRILGVTFTRKASGEMQQRLQKLLRQTMVAEQQQNSIDEYDDDDDENALDIVQESVGDIGDAPPPGLDRVSLGTFHSICAKILRWNGDSLSHLPSVIDDMSKSQNQTVLDGTFNIVDQGEQLRILRDCVNEQNIDLKSKEIKLMDVLNSISSVKTAIVQGQNPFERKGTQSVPMRIAKELYYPYREKLLSSNCIDFDDLIYLTRELLLVNYDVRERLQRRWTHVLVDEFQDTSQSQLDLVKLLTSTSLFVVGDADQSIYSWRGAHAGSMTDFEHEFKDFNSNGVSTVYLMENYRSTSNIVKAAQRVISSSAEVSDGHKLRQKMIPQRSKGTPPRVVACQDGKKEAELVVKEVKQKLSSGVYANDRSVAFIYRTNAQSRALEEACVLYNLPYVIFGSATSFYKRQEIKDCLCFLRWLYNGRDRSSMLRAMTTPKRGIGDSAIREFDQYCTLVDELWEELAPTTPKPTPLQVLLHLAGDYSWCTWNEAEFPPPSVAFSTRSLNLMTAFAQQMRKLRDKAYSATVEQVLASIVDDMELIPHFDKISKSKAEFEERQENVHELQQASRRYSDMGPCLNAPNQNSNEDGFTQSALGNFLDDVALVTDMADDSEKSSEERFVVNLMTIHSSKGMEFDTVFFVGIEDGTVPTSQALKEGTGSVVFEEEKRLCYVAMTRARSELVMTWRREVPIYTKDGIRNITRNRSRFLDVLVARKEKNLKGGENSPNAKRQDAAKYDRGITGKKTSSQTLVNPTNAARYTHGRSLNQSRERQSYPRQFSPGEKRNLTTDIPIRRATKKYEGTASVYSKQKPFIGQQSMSPSVPKPSKRSTALSEYESSPRRAPSNGIEEARNARQSTSRHNPSMRKEVSAKKSKSKPKQNIDPSWFFPVGSKVMHQHLGKGVVLPPKSRQNDEEMQVLVQFRDGRQKEFPINGSELSPIVF